MTDGMWWSAWALALIASTCEWDWRKAAALTLSCVIVAYGRIWKERG